MHVVRDSGWGWPATADALVAVQHALARAARDAPLWPAPVDPVVGGCFVAFARGEQGPGAPGDRAWAGAVAWHDGVLVAEVVVFERVRAAYEPGLLALREGPILQHAVEALPTRPDVLLVDATGFDHPRRAGLAVHLGAVVDLPTVGVTHRSLVAHGDLPTGEQRGATTPLTLDGDVVAHWVRTRSRTRPVVAHAAWRTTPETATAVVLHASPGDARTPAPLQQARRAARAARARADYE